MRRETGGSAADTVASGCLLLNWLGRRHLAGPRLGGGRPRPVECFFPVAPCPGQLRRNAAVGVSVRSPTYPRTRTPFLRVFARKRRYAQTLPLTCTDPTTNRHARHSFPTSGRERQRRRPRVLLAPSGRAGGGRWSRGGSGVRACDERAGATSTAFSYGFLIRSVRRVAHACLRPSQVSQSTQFVRAKNQKETQWIEGDFDGA